MLYLAKVYALHFLRTRLLILQYVVFFVQLCQYFIYFLYTNRYFYHYFLLKLHTKDVSLCNLKRSKSDNVIIYFFTQSIPSFTIALFLRNSHLFNTPQHQKRGYPNSHSDILLSSFPRHTGTTYFVDSFNLSSYPRWVFFLTSFPSI